MHMYVDTSEHFNCISFQLQDEVKVVGAKNPRVVLVMAQIVLILKPKDSKYQYKHHIYVSTSLCLCM